MNSTTSRISLLIMLFALVLNGCKKDRGIRQNPTSDSFLPMQVGNIWYVSKENYTEIQDSVYIEGKLFYKFYSLIGGDASSTSYMRIDEQGKLISGDPKYPKQNIILGNFKANIGTKFFTTSNGDDGDQEVTIIEKTDTQISFSYDRIYHPNLKDHPYVISYLKGQGFPGDFTKLRINGVQIR